MPNASSEALIDATRRVVIATSLHVPRVVDRAPIDRSHATIAIAGTMVRVTSTGDPIAPIPRAFTHGGEIAVRGSGDGIVGETP